MTGAEKGSGRASVRTSPTLRGPLERLVAVEAVDDRSQTMTVARSAAEVLSEHVTLEVECIDRMYLNLYVPILQREQGIAFFWRHHRGYDFVSSALMSPMSREFVSKVERFAERKEIDLIRLDEGTAEGGHREGVLGAVRRGGGRALHRQSSGEGEGR